MALAAAFSGLPLYTTRQGNAELLQVFLASADIPSHVPSGDLISESTVAPQPSGLALGLVRGVVGVPVSALEHGGCGTPH